MSSIEHWLQSIGGQMKRLGDDLRGPCHLFLLHFGDAKSNRADIGDREIQVGFAGEGAWRSSYPFRTGLVDVTWLA